MNKKIVFTGLLVVILLIAGYIVMQSDETETNSNNSVSNTVVADKPAEVETVKSSDNYVDFSEEKLISSADTKRVVFFHAEWCSTCKFYEKQIETSGVPEGITILKADYDKEDELKKRYGVTVQSTFVLLDESGEVERTWPFAQGLSGIDDLYSEIL